MGWESYPLNEKLVKALEAAGFEKPTDIQEKALEYVNHPVDLIIASKTVEDS